MLFGGARPGWPPRRALAIHLNSQTSFNDIKDMEEREAFTTAMKVAFQLSQIQNEFFKKIIKKVNVSGKGSRCDSA